MVHMYHIFIVHSSIIGHYACFYFLVIVNRIVINIAKQEFIECMLPFCICIGISFFSFRNFSSLILCSDIFLPCHCSNIFLY